MYCSRSVLRLVGSCSVTEVLVVSAQTQQTAVSWTMSEYTGGTRLDTKHTHRIFDGDVIEE